MDNFRQRSICGRCNDRCERHCNCIRLLVGELMKLLRYLLFVIALLAPSGAWAQIGTPTTLGTASTTSNGATSLNITTTASVSAGQLVGVACFSYSSGSIKQVSNITDNASVGNTYILSSGSSLSAGVTLYYVVIPGTLSNLPSGSVL